MSIRVKDLLKILKEKDQDADVEFMVVKTNGELVCMDISTSAKSMVDLLELFRSDS